MNGASHQTHPRDTRCAPLCSLTWWLIGLALTLIAATAAMPSRTLAATLPWDAPTVEHVPSSAPVTLLPAPETKDIAPSPTAAATATPTASPEASTPSSTTSTTAGQTSSLLARPVVVGFVESAEPDFVASTIEPMVAALARGLPGRTITVARLSALTLESDLALYRPDIFVAPVSSIVTLIDKLALHPIATRKTILAKDPSRSVGGALVVRADRQDLGSIPDLLGKRLLATLPNAIDGWLALADEMNKTPEEAKRYFSTVDFFGYGMPNVLSGVLSGAYDAGIIPACLLERAEEDGLIARGALRVINAKTDASLACLHSTALFPDIVAAALPETDPGLAKDITIALLSGIPDEAGYSWQVTSDFHSVRALQKKLHLGAWEYLNDKSLASLWARYQAYVVGAIAVLAFLLLSEWRLRRLVQRRTAELRESLVEQDRLQKAEMATREKLKQLERMGAISQLCAMIAHELKQPVTSVINYTAILKLKLQMAGLPPVPPDGTADGTVDGRANTPSAPVGVLPTAHASALPQDEVVAKAVAGAEREARRIATIVDRVRFYAKRDLAEHEPVNVVASVMAAIRESESFRVGKTVLEPNPFPLSAWILGHGLEIELLVLNLLKNAHEALAKKSDAAVAVTGEATVWVRLTMTDTTVTVSVADNGPPVSDADFEKLKSVSESVKPEGLGLGLAIVRNIVDEHGARFAVERRVSGGIAVTVTFDRAPQEAIPPVTIDDLIDTVKKHTAVSPAKSTKPLRPV